MSEDTLPKPKTRKRGMRENETYWEKTVRKCSAEPLVPIGGLVTAGILMGGLRSFATKNSRNSQNWMRARVIAQGCTILAVVAGSQFIKPYKPALYEEQMERKLEEQKLNSEEWKADQN